MFFNLIEWYLNIRRKQYLIFFYIFFSFAATLQVFGANVITVTNLNDTGVGSLRKAISSAAVGDTIVFDNTLSGTIYLTSGELAITQDVIINGTGTSKIQVSGNSLSRVFNISTGINVYISRITIRDGYTTGSSGTGNGAGIYNDGSLSLQYCDIKYNKVDDIGTSASGAGILNYGTLNLEYCNVSNNEIVTSGSGTGVGIRNFGTANINQSNISDNSSNGTGSFSGGGICSTNASHILNINNSAVFNNYATFAGGIYIGSNGNGYLKNVTISNNIATTNAGGIACWGGLELINCTIASNTNEGLRSASTNSNTTIINSIFNANTVADIQYIYGTINSGYTSISDNSYALYGVNDQVYVTNLYLSELQDNGGFTLTHALGDGSAAIDNGNNAKATTTDQRNYNRIANSVVDRGAFEYNANALEPTSQAPGANIDFVSTNKVHFTLVEPTIKPENFLVLRRVNGDPTTPPEDGQEYTANTDYSGQKVIYAGSNIEILDTYSLLQGTTYAYDIFAYNGTGSATNYYIVSPLNFLVTTQNLHEITSFSQTKVTQGDIITIYGNYFDSEVTNNQVWVGGIEATIDAADNSKLVISIPEGIPPVSEVTVFNKTTGLTASSLKSGSPFLYAVFNGGELSSSYTYTEDETISTDNSLVAVTHDDISDNSLNDIIFSANSRLGIAYRKDDNTGFKSPVYYSIPYSLDKIAITDFNNDGVSDICGINYSSSKIVVLIQKTDHSDFETYAQFEALSSPLDIKATDLNDDGFSDVVVTGTAQIAVLYRNGTNDGFDSPSFYGVGSGVSNIVLADFNLDNKIDIATTLEASNDNLKIYLQNSGDGSYYLNSTYSIGNAPTEIVTADFNNDTYLDLVALNTSDNKFTIASGNGDGTFNMKNSFVTGDFPYAIEAGDFNGDGNIDIITSEITNNQFSIHVGDGSLSFTQTLIESTGDTPEDLTISDFNHDGKSDIAVVYNGDSKIGIYYYTNPKIDLSTVSPVLNNYNIGIEQYVQATFDKNVDPSSANATSITLRGSLSGTKISGNYSTEGGVVTIDPNTSGDDFIAGEKVLLTVSDGIRGENDEVFTGVGSTNYKVKTETGPTEFIETSSFSTENTTADFSVADFNGDNLPDLAFINNADKKLGVYENLGDGSFSASNTYSLGNDPRAMFIADFDNNGANDIAVTDKSDNTVHIYTNDGNGNFSLNDILSLTGEVTPLDLTGADFNNDGNIDLAVAYSATNMFGVYQGTGDGSFTHFEDVTAGTTNVYRIATGDVNNDGRFDLFVGYGGSDDVEVFENTNSGFVSLVLMSNGASIYTASQLMLEDVNNDNYLDLIYSNYYNNTIYVQINKGNEAFAAAVNLEASAVINFDCNDIDGDGNQDIIYTSSADNKVGILKGAGDGTFTEIYNLSTGNTPIVATAFPIDSDYDLDIAVLNETDNTISVFLNDAEPEITISNLSIAETNITRGTTQNPIYELQFDVAKSNTILQSISFKTNGTYSNSDIESSGFQLWYNTTNDISSASQIGSSLSSTIGTSETLNYTGLNQSI